MRLLLQKIFSLLLGLFYIVWFFIPVSVGNNNLLISPYSTKSIILYVIPLLGIFKIVTAIIGKKIGFLGNPNGILLTIIGFLETSLMLFTAATPVIKSADSVEYFITIPIFIYVLFGVVVLINIISVVFLMKVINRKSKTYREYKEFKKNSSGANILFRIRTKLFFSFIGIITVIVVVLSIQLLSNYRITLIKAISDGANNQVQQSSATYRINLGVNITLFDYFNRQIELNNKASFQYRDLSIFTNLKSSIYMDGDFNNLEEYPSEFSTLYPGIRNPEQEPLSKELTLEYLTKYKDGKEVVKEDLGNQIKFISPIIKNDTVTVETLRVKKERFLGFSIITFDKNVIMKPYFMVRNLVVTLTLLFLYISIILIYLVGNVIVNPILFLRMNVKKISTILQNMINGNIKVNANSLIYVDSIKSRDEIKFLSKEINDMVSIIRGIIPYISASTLQYADKKEKTSIEKEITFLFTDIRGFTTLCEGMSPPDVVDVLNKYLNLETQIILDNNGDIDKFVGDEVMAFFEGPEKDINACRAAMQIRLAMMNEKDIRKEKGLPIVDIGIGINTGKVVFGSVGANNRMDFTSIGDTVNLAARLEGANKAFGSKSIISESVFNNVKDIFLCRELDSIAVKGKNEPVRIYEIIQEKTLVQPKLLEIKSLFELGLEAYRARKWEDALNYFGKNFKQYKDKPSEVFIQRVNHFISTPPDENWDGVFRMTVK